MARSKSKEFRFGIGENDTLMSRSFKIWINKEDIYITCREMPGMKYSFHESGIYRWALNSDKERAAAGRFFVNYFQPGVFAVVCRIIFSSQHKWRAMGTGQKLHLLPPLRKNQFGIMAIGLVPHHPMDYPHTSTGNHVWISKLSEQLHVSACWQIIAKDQMKGLLQTHLSPKGEIVQAEYRPPETPGVLDINFIYENLRSTFHWWGHYNVHEKERGEFYASDLRSAMRRGTSLRNTGYYVGQYAGPPFKWNTQLREKELYGADHIDAEEITLPLVNDPSQNDMVISRDLPLIRGREAEDLCCGKCGIVLAKNISRKSIYGSAKSPSGRLVLVCPCGAFSAIPIRQGGVPKWAGNPVSVNFGSKDDD